jgi:hypothetical protein
MRNAHSILVGKPEGKRPLGRPRRRWEHNIRINLRGKREAMCGLDASVTGQGSIASLCEQGNELSESIKGGKSLD